MCPAFLLVASAILPVAGRADEKPPANSKTIIEIVAGLEKQEYAPIIEVSFDDGVWEVEAYKGDAAFELTVDPSTGEIVNEHRDEGDRKPPADSLSLSEILSAVEKAGFAELNDVSFEGKSWEAEATRDSKKRELRIDGKTGKVIADRADD
jgi:uncharacterized membrane protein YkoI